MKRIVTSGTYLGRVWTLRLRFFHSRVRRISFFLAAIYDDPGCEPQKERMRRFLIWFRQLLGSAKIARRLYRQLPSTRRYKECLVPFLGLFSVPFRFVQIRPSRKNPNLCTL